MVLVASNDGMLHALDRKTGNEKWAFVPTEVMKNMYKLADENFEFNHVFYVDGSPQMGDIQINSGTNKGQWRTIVVGGLNKGGRSYYALDLTDTNDPKLLWQFKHNDRA
ncbi:PQQ-binding-like beta-propeller repeat protein [Ramlibacter terrae]|uniref:PQQ-binding-like beta-propeller repeat protein n=1 Tax=Ramlibacter terrae TaxID=2732511 RepID=A0ABX6P1X9_9BURK|nr:PQQ-binding-like beta-propeller repeat protein [Ramlibacter terrae]